MTDLERYRDEIDEIDSEIVRLFEKRMKVSEEVAEYKIKTGKQVLDPARESQKIHTLKNKAHGDFNSLGVQELFRQIMAISRKRQYQLLTEHGIYGERNFTTVKHVPLENATVVFQGVEGAYSYAAMRQYFGKNIESYHVKTWRTAMEDVTHGKADYAVLPIENSTAGIVADIYDLLMEYKLYIVGEQIIRVDHVLLSVLFPLARDPKRMIFLTECFVANENSSLITLSGRSYRIFNASHFHITLSYPICQLSAILFASFIPSASHPSYLS